MEFEQLQTNHELTLTIPESILSVTVTRHGPKDGLDGELTENGRRWIENYYRDSLKNNTLNTMISRKLFCSPKNRCRETAKLFQQSLKSYLPSLNVELIEEERLSEKFLVSFIRSLPSEYRDDWFRHWYVASVGQDAAVDLAKWLIDQITTIHIEKKPLLIDAFSHGPVMAAFILRLEEKSNLEMLPTKSNQDRLHLNKLFSSENGDFNYLSSFSIHVPNKNTLEMYVILQNKIFSVPISLLYDLVNK